MVSFAKPYAAKCYLTSVTMSGMTLQSEATTAQRIDSLMRRYGFHRADLAREWGIARSSVTQKFQKNRFTLKDVCSIADLFDVSVDYLLGRSEEAGDDD